MFVETHTPSGDPSSLSYMLGCAGQGKAVVVDAHADEVEHYLALAEARGVRIVYAVDTHVHADHLTGAFELARRSGADYVLHRDARCKWPHRKVDDGDWLEAGNVKLQVMHTPGHTLDSICLQVTDASRTDAPWFLLTGHTWFVGSVGRPDLRGRAKEMAGLLYHSLHDKLLTLPDFMEIHPGARAGSVCGAGLSGKPVSTVGFEKRHNPVLSLDEEAFVEQVLSTLPPEPEGMQAIVRANSGS